MTFDKKEFVVESLDDEINLEQGLLSTWASDLEWAINRGMWPKVAEVREAMLARSHDLGGVAL